MKDNRTFKEILIASLPAVLIIFILLAVAYKFVDPAPPRHIVIATGGGDGDYETYAKLYRDIIKEDGVELRIRPTNGVWENLKFLQDPHSDVDVAFVEDGFGSAEKFPDVSSLGSIYYDPIWIFYRSKNTITRFSQLAKMRLGLGRAGGGNHTIAKRILKSSGVDEKNSTFVNLPPDEQASALRAGKLDAAFFLATPEDPLIKSMIKDPQLKLMSVDQAEAVVRQQPYLHHLVLPHGAMDLALNYPKSDVDLIAPTTTLLVRDSLHPALSYLLLRVISQVHSDPGIFEKKNEFPIDKDYEFPLTDEAKTFYKSGTPFWQRYLPFWLATLVERFIVLVIPALVILVPFVKVIPKIIEWRLKSRFYQRYGELKFLELQIESNMTQDIYDKYLKQLDEIEERVNHMKFPLAFSDQIYVLREHIHFVRKRLQRFKTG